MPGFQTGDDNQTTVEVTQINLNHCDTAQQLLWQSTTEFKCDVAIIAEPYQIPQEDASWIADHAKIAAIWTMGRYPVQEVVFRAEEGFVIAKINEVYVCSCYAPPRWTLDQFNQMLDQLTDELTDRRPVVIAGDFNAWASEWGSRRTNPRGRSLLEALAKLNVDLANEGTTSTYCRDGRESIIDVTFCSPGLVRKWRVCESYTHSDHQGIRYCIGDRAQMESARANLNGRQWKTADFDEAVFVEALRWENSLLNLNGYELTKTVARACDASMPRKVLPKNRRRPVYWWNATLADLRATCLRTRRNMQRAGSDIEREERRAALRTARSEFSKAIKLSKAACLKELCRKANDKPWGDAYKVVMAKIRGPAIPPERCPEKVKAIIEQLFPLHEPIEWPTMSYDEENVNVEESRVTNEELIAVAKRLKMKKAPGPDGIPNQALKTAILTYPDMFRTTMQKCIDEGCFPDEWKRQKLVLIPKPGKPPGDPSAYRPICLLDTLGKLLERVILNRLVKYTEGEYGLSDTQFGFRKHRSTVDAIKAVVETANKAKQRKRRGNRHCAVITLDVRNAFNSASWGAIATSLHNLRVPGYLYRILKSYFQNRILIYETDSGQRTMRITAGVPQGSILGPTLWNAMYDGVLKLDVPRGVKIVGFADDIVLTVSGETHEEVEVLATEAIDKVENWMVAKELAVAHHKTEVMMITNHKTTQQAEISVGEYTIVSNRKLKYLGVMIDDRLNFNCHVDYASEKATKAIAALTRIMPNNSALSSSKRKLLASVSTSVLRYGAPVWKSALQTRRNQARLCSTHRLMSMRVASAYRTISLEAVCVIAGMIPIGLLLEEDSECYNQRGTIGVRKRTRIDTMRKWQEEWDNAVNGRWTHRLIPNLSIWMTRKHGEVNFHLTQALSDHGCFRKYLHRFGHAQSPHCPECVNVEENAEHVIFICPRFESVRRDLLATSGEDTSPDNMIHRMCRDYNIWDTANRVITQIMSALQQKWRNDQRTIGRTVSGDDPPSGDSPPV